MKIYEVNIYDNNTLEQSTLWSNEMQARIVQSVGNRGGCGYRAELAEYADMRSYIEGTAGHDTHPSEILERLSDIDQDITPWLERMTEMDEQ